MAELYTALVTPFRENNTIDLYGLKKLIDIQLEASIDGLVILGTTGESELLTEEEKHLVVHEVLNHVKNRIPIMVGTGSSSTSEMLKFSQFCLNKGAEKVMVVSPFYVKPSQEGVIEHYRVLSKNQIPFLFYHHPFRSGCHLTHTTIETILNMPFCKGLKDASGAMDLMLKFGKKFTIYSGDDLLLLPHLSLGASGLISVISNLIPKELKEIMTCFFINPKTALQEFESIQKLIESVFIEPNPIGIKAALSIQKTISNQLRLPYVKASTETINLIESWLYKLVPN